MYKTGDQQGPAVEHRGLDSVSCDGLLWKGIHMRTHSITELLCCTHETTEKAMATHSSVLAWRIPGTEEPGALPSMGSLRVGHD